MKRNQDWKQGDSQRVYPSGQQVYAQGWQPGGPFAAQTNPSTSANRGKPQKPQGSSPGRPNRSNRLFLLIVALALLAGLGYWGITELRNAQVRQLIAPYQGVYAPNVFINDVPLEGLAPEDAYNAVKGAMQERISGWHLNVAYQGFNFVTLNYGMLGIEVSDEELYRLLNEAWLITNKGSIHERKAAIDALGRTPHKAYTTQKELQSNQLAQALQQIAPYVNASPVDAAILEFRPDDEEPFVIQSERPGAALDTQAAMNDIMAMAAAGQSGTYELKPQLIQPTVTKAMLESQVSLRTSITTAIAASSPENRNHNIRLSFSKFNGMILRPGQTFSFNNIVGPRTLSAGFAEALEYAYGDLVTGVGGGVCQASTTLYQAALTAGLGIVKRLPHSGKVDYTEMGQDATVYLTRDRNLDFQFKNTTQGDIYITARVKPSRNNSRKLVAEIRMYGVSLGDGVSYRLRSETVQIIPPPEEKKYEVDATGLIVTYTDEEKLKSKAVEGQVVETYLEKYQNGVLIEQPRLLTSDTFNAKPAVYWRGNTKRN